MNETIKTLRNHRTTRQFKTGEVIPEQHRQAILEAMQQAPSWMNGQHYSVIAIDDVAIKTQLVALSPRNPHLKTCSLVLLFCMDMTLQQLASQKEAMPFDVSDSSEVLLTMATDTALAMQNAVIASESLGYGTVCVGGIRQVANELISLCQLPKYTYPLCALCIGVVDTTQPIERIKPRVASSIKVHNNVYQDATIDDVIYYDDVMKQFGEERETIAWSDKFAQYYKQNPNVMTNKWLKEQGF